MTTRKPIRKRHSARHAQSREHGIRSNAPAADPADYSIRTFERAAPIAVTDSRPSFAVAKLRPPSAVTKHSLVDRGSKLTRADRSRGIMRAAKCRGGARADGVRGPFALKFSPIQSKAFARSNSCAFAFGDGAGVPRWRRGVLRRLAPGIPSRASKSACNSFRLRSRAFESTRYTR